MGSVPQKVLDNASWRGGINYNRSVETCSSLETPGNVFIGRRVDSILPYFRAYLKFREEYEFQPIPPYEDAYGL